MTRLFATIAMLTAAAHVAAAQSAPNIMKPKQAAARAVAATNAQTAASTSLPEDSAGALDAQSRRMPRAVERAAATDSAAGSTNVSASTSPAPTRAAGFDRETFAYDRSGRRDPFVSLMNTTELRPYVSDLRLVAVAYDAKGRNSVAVLRDLGTKEQYRVRIGQSLGRMHVASIAPKAVVFTIEEFGYSRQETLALGDSNTGVKK